MKIMIGFSKHKGFAPMSNLIRMYMGTPFSHTYLKLKLDCFDKPSVFHAVGKGLILLSYDTFLEHNQVVAEFELDISDDLFKEICNTFHNKASSSYGYLQNLGIILADKFKLNKNPLNDGINCSEWISYCLEEVYPNDWNESKQDFNLITPKQVYNYLVGKNGKI